MWCADQRQLIIALTQLTVHGRETLKFAYECQNGFHPQEPDVSEQLRKARQKSQAALLRQGTAGNAAEAGSFIGTPQGVRCFSSRDTAGPYCEAMAEP